MTTSLDGHEVDTDPVHHSVHGHVVHRVAHAIYGLIILTTIVGELRTQEEDMTTAIVAVGIGGLVLVFAHAYSQLVAVASMTSAAPRSQLFLSGLVDQLSVAIPAVASVGVFVLAQVDIISDEVAYNIVLAGALATLFVLGVAMGRHRGKSLIWSVGLGVGNTVVGTVIIIIEAVAAH